MDAKDAMQDYRIRIMHGGPFYDVMSRLGLRKRSWRAFAFGFLCWIVPLFMLLADGDGYQAGFFLHDWGAWARFLIAPVLFTLTEQPIGFALDECAAILFRTPLIASRSMDDARRALADAVTRATAWVPELICLLVAIVASVLNFQSFFGSAAPGWASSQGNLTIAGIWCVAVSNTIYWFLLARLVWKHVLWARLLSAISNCHLRLAVTHPDGHGGLGFISFYPAGYALFTLGISSVVAAGIGHVMQREAVTPTLFTVVCAGWLTVVFLYYALPLSGLAMNIGRLKRKAVLLSMAKATDFERRLERTLVGENIFPDETETETVEFRDVKPVYQASLKTSALLINKGNVLPVLVPALLPLLVVGASYLSYSQLGPIMKRFLLL
jgi:hypothetical protein